MSTDGRSGYKHYRNRAPEGSCVFVTTTCLDFVHAFQQPNLAKLMCASLLGDCLHYGAGLSAFVVMPHHIHFLCRLPADMSAQVFVQRVKTNSARRIVPKLGNLAREFDEQRGLNKRTFWKVGFRSVEIDNPKAFWTKVIYIHANPVRAGLCESYEEYAFGSGSFWSERWHDEKGLVYGSELVESFAPRADLDYWKSRRKAGEA